jgi:hypothetical protein
VGCGGPAIAAGGPAIAHWLAGHRLLAVRTDRLRRRDLSLPAPPVILMMLV